MSDWITSTAATVPTMPTAIEATKLGTRMLNQRWNATISQDARNATAVASATFSQRERLVELERRIDQLDQLAGEEQDTPTSTTMLSAIRPRLMSCLAA